MAKLINQLEIKYLPGRDGCPRSSLARGEPAARARTCSKMAVTTSSWAPSQTTRPGRYLDSEAGTNESTLAKHNRIHQSIINNKRHN